MIKIKIMVALSTAWVLGTLHGITINSQLAKQADIDIYISKSAPPALAFASPLVRSQGPIATYSFFLDAQDIVQFWQTLYDSSSALNISNPDSMLPATSRMHPPTHDIEINLTADDIERLYGQALSCVYVTILQRTYYFDQASQSLQLFSKETLASQLFGVNATITLEASGNINPTMWNALPASLKAIYTVAQGNVS